MRKTIALLMRIMFLLPLLTSIVHLQTVAYARAPDYSKLYDSILARATEQMEATESNIAYGFLDASTDLNGNGIPDYDEAKALMESYGTPPPDLADPSIWREYMAGLEEAKKLFEDLDEYCGYTIGFWKNHPIVTWLASVAFEDIPVGYPEPYNVDWDYNDFVTEIKVEGIYTGINIVSMKFTFEAQARGALFHHTQHLLIPANTFASDGTYTVSYYDASGALISKLGPAYFDPTVDIDLTIFDDTWEALPPNGPINEIPVPPYKFSANTVDGSGTELGRTTDVSFAFTTAFPFDLAAYGPSSVDTHGEGLFFDPYLQVWVGDEWLELGLGELPDWFPTEIHLSNLRMLIISVDWKWPELAAFIGLAYETVTLDPVTELPVFPDDWYLADPTDYIWTP